MTTKSTIKLPLNQKLRLEIATLCYRFDGVSTVENLLLSLSLNAWVMLFTVRSISYHSE